MEYKGRCKSLAQCEFSAINWPPGLLLPWATRPECAAAGEGGDEASEADFVGPNGVILPSGNVSFTSSGKKLFKILKESKEVYLSSGVVCAAAMASDGTLKLEQISDHGFRSLIERHCELFARRSGPHGESLLKVGGTDMSPAA